MTSQHDWKSLLAAKKADQASRIPAEWKLPEEITSLVSPESSASAFDLFRKTSILTQLEHEITEKYDATSLLGRIAVGHFTALEVTTAFCKRAAIAHQLTNCLTEIFFDKAIKRAIECDEYLRENGKPIGPLHGLPISVKDLFMVEGEASTIGFVSYLARPPATHNSVLIQMLLDAGAILFCKTNVPQRLFVCESRNNVFGTTLNPHRLSLTSGGSSSGEGALVGFRGSLLGAGSDIGGSVRGPSLCCGVYGFKPSANRLPWAGQQELIPSGWPGVVPSVGPHAVSARDLTLFTRNIIAREPWHLDAAALPIVWRDVPRKETLNIGVWLGDSQIPVTPPVLRTLKAAAERLAAAGNQVKFVECPSLVELLDSASLGYKLDTSGTMESILATGGEEPIQAVQLLAALQAGEPIDLDSVWKFNRGREIFLQKWAKVWKENALDVLICPGSRQVAPAHNHYGVPVYTIPWNFLDFPASVIPFGKVDKSLDNAPFESGVYPLRYDVDTVDGAPCSVQVVGWRYMDEETLSATELISEILHGREELGEESHGAPRPSVL
ncbi:amidase [Aspergillus keveii]|uniref:amidase n=1 Tax=Aspergillus keveii TaxID=714993 RepID=A0ABR4GI59_9EURO